MKSIQINYNNIQRKNPNLGPYPCLSYAVRNKNFSRDTISRFFVKIIPKDEYDKFTKNDYIDQLTALSNLAVEHKIGVNNDL
jgi:hypothetical protein